MKNMLNARIAEILAKSIGPEDLQNYVKELWHDVGRLGLLLGSKNPTHNVTHLSALSARMIARCDSITDAAAKSGYHKWAEDLQADAQVVSVAEEDPC